MIESPVLMRLIAEREAQGMQRGIRALLRVRFTTLSPELLAALEGVVQLDRLEDLNVWAALCPDIEAFAAKLTPTV